MLLCALLLCCERASWGEIICSVPRERFITAWAALGKEYILFRPRPHPKKYPLFLAAAARCKSAGGTREPKFYFVPVCVLFGNTHSLVFRNSHGARSIGIGMSRRSPRVHRARDFFEPLVDKFISRQCPDLFIAPKLSRSPSDQSIVSGEQKFTSSSGCFLSLLIFRRHQRSLSKTGIFYSNKWSKSKYVIIWH